MTGLEIGLLLTAIGGGAASSIAGGMSQRRQAEQNAQTSKEVAQMNIDADKAAQILDLIYKEGVLDPFRGQMFQANNMAKLDMMENATYSPVRYGADPRYGAPMTPTGGFNYTMSPEARAGAGALKKSVMAGRTAPTATDPANAGKSSVLDLLRVAAGGTRADTDDAFSMGAPSRPSTLSPTRRNAVARGARAMPVRSPNILDRYAY